MIGETNGTASTAGGDLVSRLLAEGAITLSAAAGTFASFWAGRRPHPSTFARWAHRGHKRPDGTVVKLEVARCGGKLLTSRAALERFIRAQQPTEAAPAVPPARSPTERGRESAQVLAELARLGAK